MGYGYNYSLKQDDTIVLYLLMHSNREHCILSGQMEVYCLIISLTLWNIGI